MLQLLRLLMKQSNIGDGVLTLVLTTVTMLSADMPYPQVSCGAVANWKCVEQVDCVWNVMAHAQKPDFVFRRNGRVRLNSRGRHFSRLLAAEVLASAVVMLDEPCSELVWRVLATHSISQFPLQFPSRASSCAITFQLDSTADSSQGPRGVFWLTVHRNFLLQQLPKSYETFCWPLTEFLNSRTPRCPKNAGS